MLSLSLRISISIILLIFLFKQVDKKILLETIKGSNKYLLFLSLFIFFITYPLGLLRWKMLLNAADIRLSFKRVIIAFAGGMFFNLFLPSTIGGDLVRSLDLAAHTRRPREVVATVFLDRLSGYMGLVAMALLAVSFGRSFIQDKSVFIYIAIITAILIGILTVSFNNFLFSKINKLLRPPNAGRIREWLRDLHQEIHIFKRHKKAIVNNLVLSFIIQAINPAVFYVIALSLGIKINIVYFFVFLPIISAVTMLPISIGGLGLRDATTIFFFTRAGVSKDLTFAMSLLAFFFILICASVGGIIYVLTVHHRRIQYHKAPAVCGR